jgi:V/A-type H+-transporting ATPase subunit I
MFADLGHGLLLFGLGMLLRQKGNGSIRTWGTLLAASGAAASIGGLGTGELFGFHFEQIAILAPLADALPFIGMLSVWFHICRSDQDREISIALQSPHLIGVLFRFMPILKDGISLI